MSENPALVPQSKDLCLKPQRHFSSLYPVTQAAFHFQPFSVLNWIPGWKSDSLEGVGKDNPTI